MSVQQVDQTQSSIEVPNNSIIESIIGSVTDASATSPPSTTPQIPKVPRMVREKDDYKKYYVPKVVSIGPYHFGYPKLQLVEKLKPVFAMKLFSDDKEALTSLYKKLHEMVQELRSFYEENSTAEFSNHEFTKMMLLDSCFILYFINFVIDGSPEQFSQISKLKLNEIVLSYQDLFLLENQIPFKALMEAMKLTKINWVKRIGPFIDDISILIRRRRKRKWLEKLKLTRSNEGHEVDDKEPNHLLGALYGKLTRIVKSPKGRIDSFKFDGYNFRNVSELVDVGIHFKPIKDNMSLTHIEFVKGWWGCSANVKLPPIAVNESTKPMLLNLIAYETCCCSFDDHTWVTSYVCLLDSLIDDAEDVKVLRKAWVLENSLGSDKEVAELFNEIATDLVPYGFAYLEAKDKIQIHYESWSNTLLAQLKNEYFKSPWAIFVLLGTLIALFFTGVQTYFTVWSPESKCDDFCTFLKVNHHL